MYLKARRDICFLTYKNTFHSIAMLSTHHPTKVDDIAPFILCPDISHNQLYDLESAALFTHSFSLENGKRNPYCSKLTFVLTFRLYNRMFMIIMLWYFQLSTLITGNGRSRMLCRELLG